MKFSAADASMETLNEIPRRYHWRRPPTSLCPTELHSGSRWSEKCGL